MKRYLDVFFRFFKLSWVNAMQYRINFFTWLSVDFLWSVIDLIFLEVLVNNIQVIGHWNKGQIIIVVGFYRILNVPVWGWLYQSFQKFVQDVKDAKLDLILTKPMDAQFTVSVQKFSFSLLSSLVTGAVFVAYGLSVLKFQPDILSVLLFLWFFAVSTLLIYAMYFFVVAFALFFDRINNIQQLFPPFFDSSRFPKEIYTGALRHIFSTVIPIALMLTVPVDALFGSVAWKAVIILHAMTVVFLVSGRLAWRQGLRRYSSAA